MIILDLFSLLFPGEYTGTKLESKPICLFDVGLRCGKLLINYVTASEDDLNNATFTTLTFTTQKNGV